LRIALLALAAACLVAAILGGLARLGVDIAVPGPAALHALLMIAGFLGTVISLERAVALGSPPALAAPFAAGSGTLLYLLGTTGAGPAFLLAGQALLIAAPLLLFGASVVIVRRQARLDTALLALASLAWLAGNVLFLRGAAADTAAAWWFAFLVLTIAAERLEMTRLMKRRAVATPLFIACVALLLAGAILLALGAAAGAATYGAGLVALAAWLATFDIARRTVRTEALARYAAVALLCGYAWLAAAGIAWMLAAGRPLLRDLSMHAIGLGFVFSMIFAHGPVIVPAIARVRVRFTPLFYAPLALLHASLLLRVAFAGEPAARLWGGALNAAAIALFAATLVARIRRT